MQKIILFSAATLFTKEDFPQRLGEMRIVLMQDLRFDDNTLRSCSRSINCRPVTILPYKKGELVSLFIIHKCKLHYCKLQVCNIKLNVKGKNYLPFRIFLAISE